MRDAQGKHQSANDRGAALIVDSTRLNCRAQVPLVVEPCSVVNPPLFRVDRSGVTVAGGSATTTLTASVSNYTGLRVGILLVHPRLTYVKASAPVNQTCVAGPRACRSAIRAPPTHRRMAPGILQSCIRALMTRRSSRETRQAWSTESKCRRGREASFVTVDARAPRQAPARRRHPVRAFGANHTSHGSDRYRLRRVPRGRLLPAE